MATNSLDAEVPPRPNRLFHSDNFSDSGPQSTHHSNTVALQALSGILHESASEVTADIPLVSLTMSTSLVLSASRTMQDAIKASVFVDTTTSTTESPMVIEIANGIKLYDLSLIHI